MCGMQGTGWNAYMFIAKPNKLYFAHLDVYGEVMAGAVRK